MSETPLQKGSPLSMSYQALYRKWRPDTFEDVKGQDHIVTTLKNQIVASMDDALLMNLLKQADVTVTEDGNSLEIMVKSVTN
jgi:replication-associated recombination protein RarA